MEKKPPVEEIYRKIPLKFHIGDTAWYMFNSTMRKGRVKTIELREDKRIFYLIDSTWKEQNFCFQSRKALARYLENESISFYEKKESK